MDQSRSRGTELPCKLREGLSLLMRRLSRMKSSSGEEQQEIILKSLREAELVTSAIKMGKDTRHGRIAAFTSC